MSEGRLWTVLRRHGLQHRLQTLRLRLHDLDPRLLLQRLPPKELLQQGAQNIQALRRGRCRARCRGQRRMAEGAVRGPARHYLGPAQQLHHATRRLRRHRWILFEGEEVLRHAGNKLLRHTLGRAFPALQLWPHEAFDRQEIVVQLLRIPVSRGSSATRPPLRPAGARACPSPGRGAVALAKASRIC